MNLQDYSTITAMVKPVASLQEAPGPVGFGIECEGVTKQFPQEPRPAVDHVSLQVEAGHLVVLLGPSGSGKTTLLKMVNRLYEPTGGAILVEGINIVDLPVTDLRRRIGYVIQQVGLFPHMTIAQNIAVVPELLKWSRQKIDQRIDFLLDMVGLPRAYRKRRPRQLSGGEQQRVGLARALAADPGIMLMDEPFAAIDAITRLRLQNELLEIQRQLHKTILFVTHDVEEALRLADKIAVLREGKLVQYGSPLEIISRPQNAFVKELVGGEDVLRRMSLMEIGPVLAARNIAGRRPAPPAGSGNGAAVSTGDNLRQALARLLDSQAEALTVVDQGGRPIDRITFDDIRAWLLETQVEPPE